MPGPQPPTTVSVLSAVATLTDAEIKAGPTVPFVLVPATEVLNYSGLPTQVPLPLAFSVVAQIAGGAYTNIDGAAEYVLALGSDWSSDGMTASMAAMAQLQGTTTPQIGIANSFNKDIVADMIQPLRINSGGLQDNALAFVIDNHGTGNLTGGNAANTLKVTVLYTIIDV